MYLSLDDIPGVLQTNVVFGVVQRQAVFQILLGILTDLKWQRGQEETSIIHQTVERKTP